MTLKEMRQRLDHITRHFAVNSRPKVLCHGDFWAPNIHVSEQKHDLELAQAKEVRFIDWEKTDYGDAFEDIGMYCAHADLQPRQVYEALSFYLDRRPFFEQLRQVRLYMDSVLLNWYGYQAYDGKEEGAAVYLKKLNRNQGLFYFWYPVTGRMQRAVWNLQLGKFEAEKGDQ